jgi:ADP-ribose pyrophosphatase
MPSLILYKSKYGAAKQYAEWIAEGLAESVIFSIDNYEFKDIEKYENIVLCSGTYLGEIGIRNFLVKNWSRFQDKRVYLLAVGIVFGDDGEIGYDTIPKNIRENIGYSKVPGKIEAHQLNLLEKFIIWVTRAPDTNQIDKKLIQPVLDYINNK